MQPGVDVVDRRGYRWIFLNTGSNYRPTDIPVSIRNEIKPDDDDKIFLVGATGGKVFIREEPIVADSGPNLQVASLDEDHAWVPREDVKSEDFSATGKLLMSASPFASLIPRPPGLGTNGGATNGICTGNLIGSRRLITTAAHCFWDRKNNQFGSLSALFIPGAYRAVYFPLNGPVVWPTSEQVANLNAGIPVPGFGPNLRWVAPHGYHETNAIWVPASFQTWEMCKRDWAMAELMTPVPEPVVPHQYQAPTSVLNKNVHMHSYPSGEGPTAGAVSQYSEACKVTLGGAGGGAGFWHNCDSWEGASGAAILRRKSGKWAAWGFNKGACGPKWYAVRITKSVRKAIDEMIEDIDG